MTTDSQSSDATQNEVVPPLAIIRETPSPGSWFSSKLWWLTSLCAIISIALVWYSRGQSGDLISIEFSEGHGLKTEDRLRHRGIDIGVIERIELNQQLNGIIAHVRLSPQVRPMANEGAKFWIVRPLVSIDSIQGLDTILGAKYLAIEPGPTGSPQTSRFRGLESPPIFPPPEGSLEINLDAETRGGLENGAPIQYRGFQIGQVLQVELASDARTVRARCAIAPEYRDLVRRNSKFWNRSGWRIDIGFTGVKLDADTLAQMLSGGIEMATPTEAESSVSTGHRFLLYEKPDPEWLVWKPSIAHGQAWSRLESNMPIPIRMALRWQERRYGFLRNSQRFGWCLPLSDNSALCVFEQIDAPKSAIAGSVALELAGTSLKSEQWQNASSGEGIQLGAATRIVLVESLPPEIRRWPIEKLSESLPSVVCDVVLAETDSTNVLAIDVGRLKATAAGWEIDETVSLNPELSGLPVVAAQSSQVIGLLWISNKKRMIVPISVNR